MRFEVAAIMATWIAIVLLALAMSGLVRQVHALSQYTSRRRLDTGPSKGTKVELELVGGRSDGPVVLLFADPECRVCGQIIPEFGDIASRSQNQADFRLVYPTNPPPGLSIAHSAVIGGARGIFSALSIDVTPYLLMTDEDGVVAVAEPVGSPSALRSVLVGSLLAEGRRS